MTPMEVLILNERIKAISSLLFNFGAALVIATCARIWALSVLDPAAIAWLAAAALLFFAGYKSLYLLEGGA